MESLFSKCEELSSSFDKQKQCLGHGKLRGGKFVAERVLLFPSLVGRVGCV